MNQVSIEEAKARLPDLIDAAVSGEEVVIARGDRQLVRLVPVSRMKSRPRFGSAEGLITMTENFDEPLEDFGAYTR
jgi:prevent-host-death family protein